MSIIAAFLHPLGPALILGLGGLLVALSRRVMADPLPPADAARPSDYRSFSSRAALRAPVRALFSLAVAFASLALLLLLRTRPDHASLTWTWQPLTVAGSTLAWNLDGWSWLASLLVLLLTVTALALGEFGEDLQLTQAWPGKDAERTLWLGAAALCFVGSGNLVALASGWVLLTLALTLRLRPGGDTEPAARAWSFLSLTCLAMPAALMLLGESNVRATLSDGPFTPIVLGILWVGALVLAGVYPLHWWLTGPGHTDAGGRIALNLVAPLAGLWLAGRVSQLPGSDWLHQPEWVALGALALFGTAIVAWAIADDALRWRWVVLNRASLVVLAVSMAGLGAAEALTWLVVTFALAGGLLPTGMAIRGRWGWRWPLVLGALAVWGVPATPGFLVHGVLVFPTSVAIAMPLFALILISESLLVAALWQLVANSPGRDRSTTSPGSAPPQAATAEVGGGPRFSWLATVELGLALASLVVPLLAAGILPERWAALVRMAENARPSALLATLADARRSVWIGLALAGLGGLALGLLRRRIFSQMRGWQSGIVTVVSLEWLYQGIIGVLSLIGSGLRYFSVLGEGEGYVGWLLLAGAILWLLLRG
jgi:hypothetical protein